METEPSVARWASLLLGAMAAAYGALIELQDCGYAHNAEADQFVETFKTATNMSATIFQHLGHQKEVLLATPELEPILEAINLVASECARLSGEAAEQADFDAQFLDIAERLKQGGTGQ